MIGIICAVKEEITPFLENLEIETITKIAGLTFMCASVGDKTVVLVRSGMGKVNAAIAAQCMLDNFAVSKLIMCGVNGSIDKNLNLFDVTVCEKCTHHDLPMEIIIKDYPKMEDIWFKNDVDLVKIALECDANLNKTVMLTGEKFIDTDGRKELIDRFEGEGLLAVDMETAAVAQVALANKVPFLCIRAVSDTEEESGLDIFWQNVGKASVLAFEVCKKIIEKLK